MRRTTFLGLVFLLAKTATAGYSFQKQVSPYHLQLELEKAGFSVEHIQCSRALCEIVWKGKETKNPQAIINAHVYVDPVQAAQAQASQIRALAQKLKNGSITQTEKDDLLRVLAERLVGTD